MFEVPEPSWLDRFEPCNDGFQAVAKAALDFLSDLISELLDALVRGELHPFLELVSQKFEASGFRVHDPGLGWMQMKTCFFSPDPNRFQRQ